MSPADLSLGAHAPLIESGDGLEAKTLAPQQERKKIGTLALAALVYFSVSGGPFGMEEAVRTAGPLVCLVGMGCLPILWSLPEALITAELAPTFPEASGFVAWTAHAFGPFWGFIKGYLSWLSGVTDNALYPVITVSYWTQLLGASESFDDSGYQKMGLLFGITAVLTYLNFRGLDIVGSTAIGICLFSLAPFVVMVLVGIWKVDVHRLGQLPPGGLAGVQWNSYVNVVFWNMNYYNSASSFAGEVRNPGRSYPRAMAIAIVLVISTAALPLLVGIGATDYPDSQWEDGFFSVVASDIVGKWLGVWIVLAGSVSSIGMFESEMSSDSFQLMGMAERGLLPACFAHRSKYGTPTLGILLSASGILGLVMLSFLNIIELLNFFYCISQLIEFAAFLKLRVSHSELHRPYRIPLNTFGCVIFLLPPVAMLCYILYMAQLQTWLISLAFVAGGTLLYALLVNKAVRGCCVFLKHPHAGQAEADANPLMDALCTSVSSSSSSRHSSYGTGDEAQQHQHAAGPPDQHAINGSQANGHGGGGKDGQQQPHEV